MIVPWELRLFILQTSLLFILIGALWLKGRPVFGSKYGMRFKKTLSSEETWRRFHRKAAKVWIVSGLWLAVPYGDPRLILFIQIPGLVLISVLGIFIALRRT